MLRLRPVNDDTVKQITTEFVRSKAYRAAEKDLDHVAVCLIGHREPVPVRLGSNATRSPVYIRWSRMPLKAADDFDRAHAIHAVEVLRYVWTASQMHAQRLKDALDNVITGNDAEMVTLRNTWRDWPNWEAAWLPMLDAAVARLKRGGETVGYFDDETHQRIVQAKSLRMGRR